MVSLSYSSIILGLPLQILQNHTYHIQVCVQINRFYYAWIISVMTRLSCETVHVIVSKYQKTVFTSYSNVTSNNVAPLTSLHLIIILLVMIFHNSKCRRRNKVCIHSPGSLDFARLQRSQVLKCFPVCLILTMVNIIRLVEMYKIWLYIVELCHLILEYILKY